MTAEAANTPVTPSHAGTRTTLDDLMSTLKLLEEDEQLPPPPENRVSAWINQEINGEKAIDIYTAAVLYKCRLLCQEKILLLLRCFRIQIITIN